jgi:protein-S-isoprenylcysteine O-methyltransferase Ste14
MLWLLIQNLATLLGREEVRQRAGYPSDMKVSTAATTIDYVSTPLWILATAYSIFLPLRLGTTWSALGLVIFLLGAVLGMAATVSFAKAPMNAPVTKGAFRFCRHPGYAALLLVYFSVGVASASWVFLLLAIGWAVMLNIAAGLEERHCLERHGAAYREYLDRTPGWFGIPKRPAPRAF